MKLIARVGLALVVAFGLVASGVADEAVTLQGKVVCAKCTLKKDDAKECQNVLVVTDKDGKDVEYYITKNKVDEKFGEVCTDVRPATVTGTVSEKDGRKWITATKMERAKS